MNTVDSGGGGPVIIIAPKPAVEEASAPSPPPTPTPPSVSESFSAAPPSESGSFDLGAMQMASQAMQAINDNRVATARGNLDDISDKYEAKADAAPVSQAIEQAVDTAIAQLVAVETNSNGQHVGIEGADLDHRVTELMKFNGDIPSNVGDGFKVEKGNLVDLQETINELKENTMTEAELEAAGLNPNRASDKKYIDDPVKREKVSQIVSTLEGQVKTSPAVGFMLDSSARILSEYREERGDAGIIGGGFNATKNITNLGTGSDETLHLLQQNSDAIQTYQFLESIPAEDRSKAEQKDLESLSLGLTGVDPKTGTVASIKESGLVKAAEKVTAFKESQANGTKAIIIGAALTAGLFAPGIGTAALVGGLTAGGLTAIDDATGASYTAKEYLVNTLTGAASAGISKGGNALGGKIASKVTNNAAGKVITAEAVDQVVDEQGGSAVAALIQTGSLKEAFKAAKTIDPKSIAIAAVVTGVSATKAGTGGKINSSVKVTEETPPLNPAAEQNIKPTATVPPKVTNFEALNASGDSVALNFGSRPAVQKQNEHIIGTKEYINRVKQGSKTADPPSYFYTAEQARQLTEEALEKFYAQHPGVTPSFDDLNNFKVDLGKETGSSTSENGVKKTYTGVKLKVNSKGEIHAFPVSA